MPVNRVLFVDDDRNLRLTFPAILRMHGFEVSVAATVADTNEEADNLHQTLADCVEKLSGPNRDLLRACYAGGAKIKAR